MNETIKEIFDTYSPLIRAINDQIEQTIAPQNSIFEDDDLSYTKRKHRFIKQNLDLNIPENNQYNFFIEDSSLDSRVNLKANLGEPNSYPMQSINIDLILKENTKSELIIRTISINNFKMIKNNYVNASIFLNEDDNQNLVFSFKLSSKDETYLVLFDNKNRERENNKYDNYYKDLECRVLISYVDRYRKLFNLYEFEEKAVSEILLKGKSFTQEQQDVFKLLYDFDAFDTKELSINLMPEQKIQSLKNNI